MVEKVWLKNYPESVPSEIDTNAYPSLVAFFADVCERNSHRPALMNMGVKITYKKFAELTEAFAAYCQNVLKLNKGDRIALVMPNLIQYPVAVFGALRAGLVVVNVNPLYTAREMAAQLQDAEVSAVLILENFASVLQEVLKTVHVPHVIVTQVGDAMPGLKRLAVNIAVKWVKKMVPNWCIDNALAYVDVIREGKQYTLQPVDVCAEDIAFLQYTGGTTGVAKGAILSHGNMVSNIMQSSAWIRPFALEGEEVIITALPLYHIFSLEANLMTFMALGGLNVLITNPRDMKTFIKSIKNVGFTSITGVNTLFNALLNNPQFESVDFSKMRLTLGGGMAVQASVAKRWQEVTGVMLLEAYGLTETCPAVTINPPYLKAYNGSIGLPLSSTEVAIMDESGNELPFGEVGELAIRGPQVMQGYWNKPQETAAVLRDDGWFLTGDMATLDEEGYVRIVDRKKDMILVSGFNVYPNEVEDVACMHPGVLEAAAVGKANGEKGEVVKLVVVKKDPALDEVAIIAHCKTGLTAYKVPKVIEFRDELPKTNVGKILRSALRD